MIDKKIVIKYLTVLELPLDEQITEDMIRRNFRMLSKIYHPDTSSDVFKDGQKFLLLKDATDFLIQNLAEINFLILHNFDFSNDYNEYTKAATQTENQHRESHNKTNQQTTPKMRKKPVFRISKKIVKCIGISAFALIFCIILLINVILPSIDYNKAQTLYEEGSYSEALDIYIELGDYKESKLKVVEIENIIKRQNWVEYKGMTIELPSDARNKVTVANGIIYIGNYFDLTINEFLECIKAPQGKSFYDTSVFASSNGTKSFVIKNKTRGHGQYFYNQNANEWTTEYFDLLFCGYSTLEAIYVGQSGRAPQYIHGISNNGTLAISLQNDWHDEDFSSGTTTIIGQYRDSATENNSVTFEIVIVKN